MSYISEENLKACGKVITLIVRTNMAVVVVAQAVLEGGFSINEKEFKSPI